MTSKGSSSYQSIDINEDIDKEDQLLSGNSYNKFSDENMEEIKDQHSHGFSSTNISSDNSPTSEVPLLCSDIDNLKEQPTRQKSTRLYWADFARIFSMIAIILLHCAGYGCEQSLKKKRILPMFVLLSGTFILDPSKKFSFKKLFGHNILRLATAFSFWSSVNALLNIYLYKKNTPSQFIELFVVGEEYLWFIFMIIGCYLISPFLRLFSDDMVLARYFLGLCVFWGSLVPTLKNIFTSYNLKDAKNELDTWTERWHYHFTLEFVGYFVGGYHLVKHVTIRSIWIRGLLYVLGIADVFLISYLTCGIESKHTNKYSKDFRDTYTLTVAFYTVVLFIFFKHEIGRIQFSEKSIKIISKLSSLTFGVYLSHMIIKKLLGTYVHINQEQFMNLVTYSPVIGCPVLWNIINRNM
ncbi:hypothetical protein PIROE2DRAFT_9567 [Piromyces sp. E2]|nr:hypothetical protein PIROE2DRAFT_9567 [Piromyces sp. E2]|eukprot:OUM63830.1 hypothetical protein PIROE2DRAFT_9567 [Piromyces sp. E2]